MNKTPVQENQWVYPVTSSALIAKNPQAWVNHTVAMTASFSVPMQQPDGTWVAASCSFVRRGSHYVRCGDSIPLKLSAEAYAYYLERNKLHALAVYLGEVVADPNGSLQLMLHSGLTYACHRPVRGFPVDEAPQLKAVP
jgi:hypothetical protein